jgi:DNA polymerase-3 subunit delta
MVITLYGDNDYLINQELNSIVEEHIKEFGNLSIEHFSEESGISSIYGALNNSGLFGSNKLIILDSVSVSKEISEKIEDILSASADNLVVLVEHKLDRRSVFYKYVSKNTDFKNFSKLDINNLPKWVMDYVKNRGGEISFGDTRYLIDRAGDNQLKLSNEIDKLLLFSKKIDKSSIDLLIEQSYQNNIFQLIDSVFSGNVKRSMSIFSNLRQQKIEAPQMIVTISWQLNLIALMKLAADKNLDDISRETKQKPFVLAKSKTIASKLTLAEIKDITRKLLDIDIKSKSVSIDTDEAIKNYILELSTL